MRAQLGTVNVENLLPTVAVCSSFWQCVLSCPWCKGFSATAGRLTAAKKKKELSEVITINNLAPLTGISFVRLG